LFFISAMIVAKAGMRGADTFAQCPDGGYAAGAISKGWRPEFFAVRRETGREQSVKVRYDEGVAIRIGPEPCAVAREGRSEAGVRRPAIEPRKDYFPDADVVAKAEGKTIGGVKASLQWVRRGRRPWHVQTLFAREPGDPTSGLGGYSAGSVSGR
jgi:hypothetical protein